MTSRTRFVRRLLMAVALAAWLLPAPSERAGAASFPNGPIRWIVPQPTGGAIDGVARALAPILGQVLKVPVVVQNVPGPEGMHQIYRAAANGQTIGIGDPLGEMTLALVHKPPYDLNRFTWLGRISASVNLMVASKKSGITSFKELNGRSSPVRASTFGLSTPFVQSVMLGGKANFTVAPVNYRTIGELIVGATRGDTDVSILGIVPWLPHVKAGAVVPLLALAAARDDRMPDVPSLAEFGLADLAPFTNHRAIIAPPGLPKDVSASLIAAFRTTLEQPDAVAFLQKLNFERNALWGEEFAAVMAGIEKTLPNYSDAIRQLKTQ